MTTLEELAAELPHGFHDSYISACSIDFVARTLSFAIEIWVGDMDAEGEAREAYRSGRLVVHGLLYCELERPAVDYPFAEPKPLWMVDMCEAEPDYPLLKTLPAGAFAERLFVSNWNSFIQLAGTDAELIWDE